MMKKRLIRFATLSLVGLSLGAAIAGLSILLDTKNSASELPLVAPNIGGAFTLVNQDGKTVTDKDFAGKYLFVYFGFTYCPAICPTELQKMAEAFKGLPKAWQSRIQPIFITIDPERDTPDILKNYVGLFMPELIGLTGTPAQIEAVKKEFKIYAAKVPEDDSYTMDHSSYLYFMGLDGKALAMYRTSDTSDKIIKQIPTLDGLD